jgi:hypothetical protein
MSFRIAAATLCAAALLPAAAHAADSDELQAIRRQLDEMKAAYEGRIRNLETQLDDLRKRVGNGAAPGAPTAAAATSSPAAVPTAAAPLPPVTATAAAPAPAAEPPAPPVASAAPAGGPATANGFNPSISVILGGTYANLSQDPTKYRLQGFIPSGGEVGPGTRSFSLGESELGLAASVDPWFSGRLTFSITPENEVSVEEALFERQSIFEGATLRGGRFLSSIGYLNSIHSHAWDFVDAPLAYQAFFGGQLQTDGLHLHWVAPTDRYIELGAELGSGRAFPGSDTNRNGIGSGALYAHVGDDIGDSTSWRAGASWIATRASNRGYVDTNAAGTPVTNTFDGRSRTWVLDGVLKWAPGGNPTRTNFKLQGEWFHRTEDGTLTYDATGSNQPGGYGTSQSGWYLQAVYQFMPTWRVGVRYDRLDSGSPRIDLVDRGVLTPADFPILQSAKPSKVTAMVDWSPSEFSRFRLQLAADRSNPAVTDRQLYLQYIMSLGAHGAHSF